MPLKLKADTTANSLFADIKSEALYKKGQTNVNNNSLFFLYYQTRFKVTPSKQGVVKSMDFGLWTIVLWTIELIPSNGPELGRIEMPDLTRSFSEKKPTIAASVVVVFQGTMTALE